MNLGPHIWGFMVDVEKGQSEISIPNQEDFELGEVLTVMCEAILFLHTLAAWIKTPSEGSEPEKKAYMN